MAKSKVYTRTGDSGSTSLVGGKRVPKTSLRIDAYGSTDELNSFIGLLMEEIKDTHDKEVLLKVQTSLFSVGAYLASEPEIYKKNSYHLNADVIDLLEYEIDSIDESLPPLRHFILPGGSRDAAIAHICRTICRRAERCICKVNETEELDSLLFQFINRLSDYFFILARKLSFTTNGKENIWQNS